MQMWQVFFKVDTDDHNCVPPFIAGTHDSVWVTVKRERDAVKAAKHKMLMCYGVEISDVTVSWPPIYVKG